MAIKPVIVRLDDQPSGNRRNSREVVPAAPRGLPTISGLRQAELPELFKVGTRPTMTENDRANTEVNFRFNDGSSQRKVVTMRLGALNKRNASAAIAAVDEVLGDSRPTASRTASILETIAANDGGDVMAELPAPIAPAPAPRVASLARPASPRIRSTRPLNAFRDLDIGQAALGQAPAPPRSQQVVDAAVAPEIEVLIEIQGFATQTAYYHQVIALPNVVVLVWDTRWRGLRFSPPEGENVPEMAIQVAGSPRIFLVHPTSINIPFQNYELMVLLVSRTVDQSNEDEGEIGS